MSANKASAAASSAGASADKLVALAEQCERATGADRVLDAVIATVAGLRVVDEGHPLGRVCYDQSARAVVLPRYTASLDAAMTLRPKGWTIANIGEGDDGSWWVEMREGYLTSYGKVAMSHLKCASAALALCAAALRARASSDAGARG